MYVVERIEIAVYFSTSMFSSSNNGIATIPTTGSVLRSKSINQSILIMAENKIQLSMYWSFCLKNQIDFLPLFWLKIHTHVLFIQLNICFYIYY